MKYEITKEDWQKTLALVYNTLGMIEVKGDSVEHLFNVRLALKDILQSVVEVKEVEEGGD